MKATPKIGRILLILLSLFLVLPSIAVQTINSISEQIQISGECQTEPYISQTDWISLNWTETSIFALKICVDYIPYYKGHETLHERKYAMDPILTNSCSRGTTQTIGLTLEDSTKKSATYNITVPHDIEPHNCYVYDVCFLVKLMQQHGLSFHGLTCKATATVTDIVARLGNYIDVESEDLLLESLKYDVSIFGSGQTLYMDQKLVFPLEFSSESFDSPEYPLTIICSGNTTGSCWGEQESNRELEQKSTKIAKKGYLTCNDRNKNLDADSLPIYVTLHSDKDQVVFAEDIEEEPRTSTSTLPAESSEHKEESTVITENKNIVGESSNDMHSNTLNESAHSAELGQHHNTILLFSAIIILATYSF